MINEPIKLKKAKRKTSFNIKQILLSLFAILVVTSRMDWFNEFLFGLIILMLIKMLYDKLSLQTGHNSFEIETHYDKLNSIILAMIGIGTIAAAVSYTHLTLPTIYSV